MKGFPGFGGKSLRPSPLRVIGLQHPSPDTEVFSSVMKGQKDVGVLLGGGQCWTQPLRSGVLRGSSLLGRAATRNLKLRAAVSAEWAPSWPGEGREDYLQEVSVSISEKDLGKKKPTVWCCFTRNACQGAIRAGGSLGTRVCLRQQNVASPWGKPQPWAPGGTLGTGTQLGGTHGWGCGQLETSTAAARTEGPGVLEWGPGLWPQGLVRAIQTYKRTQSPGSGLCATAVTGKERKWNIKTFQKRQCLIKISIFYWVCASAV